MMRILLALLFTLLLGACATSYTPDPGRPFEPIPEFTCNGRVHLRNAEPSVEEINTGVWLVNRHEWTDVAIQIAARELTARGVTIAEDASKVIDMAIVTGKTETGWVMITSEIVLKVKTGDGYEATYTGVNSSAMAAALKRQIDGAMMRVVVEMLKDPKIVDYLTE